MLAAIVRRRRAARAVPARRGARRGADPAAGALPQPDLPRRRARSASSSDSRSSARSPSCRSTCRSSRATPPTESGLLMTPMMVGVLVTSTASGLLISRYGRYRAVPDRRHGDRGRRAVPALALEVSTPTGGRRRLPAAPRARPRAGDAGARARRAERGRLPPARRRNLRLDARSGRSAARSASPSSARSSRTGSATSSPSASRRGVHAPAHASPAAVQHLPPAIHAAVRRGRRGRAPSGLPHGGRRHARRVRPELAAARRAAARDGGIGRTRSDVPADTYVGGASREGSRNAGRGSGVARAPATLRP